MSATKNPEFEFTDELDLRAADIQYELELREWKAGKRDKDPDGYREFKDRHHAFRAHWRNIRDAFKPEPAEGDGVASPDTIKVKSGVNP